MRMLRYQVHIPENNFIWLETNILQVLQAQQ